MQKKNHRSYTFFLKHKTKSKIYQRNFNISENIVHTGIVGLFLTVGIVSLAFIKNPALAEFNTKLPSEAAAVVNAAEPVRQIAPNEYKSINYDRPASQNYDSGNSDSIVSAQPFPVETEAEKKEMEAELKVIETTSSPFFLPTIWAHIGKINNEFGFRRNPFGGGYEFHQGIDIGGERGDAVADTANGVVTEAGWKGGYGNMIEIDHGNNLKTRYGHLSKIVVQIGEAVQRGQIIGLIGSTGRSTGPHLHYELRLYDKPINPRRFLPMLPPEIAALKINLNGFR